MNRMTAPVERRDRWDLWNLQALCPGATSAALRILKERRREIEAIEKRVLCDGRADVPALIAAARQFIDGEPRLGRGIIATLHLGPYSLVPVPLLLAGHDPAIVLDHKAMRRIEPVARRQAELLKLKGRLEWIAVEGDHFAIRIVRALRDERPVIVYLDGNRGAGGMEATRDHGMAYRLPGRTILLRTGLGRLISRTGCEVTGLTVRWRPDGSLDWRAADAGVRGGGDSAQVITRRLYDWMFGEILATPEQWLSWEMLHESSECFATDRLRRGGEESETVRRQRFQALLRGEAPRTRVRMPGDVEVWERGLLVDLTRQHFYSAEGLRDETLDLLRWGAEPTLQMLCEACGEAWVGHHLLRLYLLDLVEMKHPS